MLFRCWLKSPNPPCIWCCKAMQLSTCMAEKDGRRTDSVCPLMTQNASVFKMCRASKSKSKSSSSAICVAASNPRLGGTKRGVGGRGRKASVCVPARGGPAEPTPADSCKNAHQMAFQVTAESCTSARLVPATSSATTSVSSSRKASVCKSACCRPGSGSGVRGGGSRGVRRTSLQRTLRLSLCAPVATHRECRGPRMCINLCWHACLA